MPLYLTNIYFKIRDLVWVILSCSTLFTAVVAFSQLSRHCRRGGSRLQRSPSGNRGVFKSLFLLGNSASYWHGKSANPQPPTPNLPHWLLLVSKASRTHSCHEFMKQADTYTGLKIWPAVTEILGSLHNRELSLFPFPELLVLFLIWKLHFLIYKCQEVNVVIVLSFP